MKSYGTYRCLDDGPRGTRPSLQARRHAAERHWEDPRRTRTGWASDLPRLCAQSTREDGIDKPAMGQKSARTRWAQRRAQTFLRMLDIEVAIWPRRLRMITMSAPYQTPSPVVPQSIGNTD